MSGPDAIVVVGEALVDIVRRPGGPARETPGGSPANVALALGRLGRRPVLVTRVGDDPRGASVRAWLAESGVDLHAVAVRGRTATADAMLDEVGSAMYRFDIDGDLGDGTARHTADAGALHVGSIGALLEPGASAVRAAMLAAAGNALITYDPNIRPLVTPDRAATRARVVELVALADVVKASDEDLSWLFPGRDARSIARDLVARGPAMIVVTRGGEGALAVTREVEIDVASASVRVVDTVGAGDTFMAALIDGLVSAGATGAQARSGVERLTRDELAHILARATAAAAITVGRPGADPPRASEVAHGPTIPLDLGATALTKG